MNVATCTLHIYFMDLIVESELWLAERWEPECGTESLCELLWHPATICSSSYL